VSLDVVHRFTDPQYAELTLAMCTGVRSASLAYRRTWSRSTNVSNTSPAGLGSVHHDLDEPQRLRVGSQPPLRGTGLGVKAADPSLVGLTGEAPGRATPVRGEAT
jgi:hypothetical protein